MFINPPSLPSFLTDSNRPSGRSLSAQEKQDIQDTLVAWRGIKMQELYHQGLPMTDFPLEEVRRFWLSAPWGEPGQPGHTKRLLSYGSLLKLFELNSRGIDERLLSWMDLLDQPDFSYHEQLGLLRQLDVHSRTMWMARTLAHHWHNEHELPEQAFFDRFFRGQIEIHPRFLDLYLQKNLDDLDSHLVVRDLEPSQKQMVSQQVLDRLTDYNLYMTKDQRAFWVRQCVDYLPQNFSWTYEAHPQHHTLLRMTMDSLYGLLFAFYELDDVKRSKMDAWMTLLFPHIPKLSHGRQQHMLSLMMKTYFKHEYKPPLILGWMEHWIDGMRPMTRKEEQRWFKNPEVLALYQNYVLKNMIPESHSASTLHLTKMRL